jgi:hypothetical protein
MTNQRQERTACQPSPRTSSPGQRKTIRLVIRSRASGKLASIAVGLSVMVLAGCGGASPAASASGQGTDSGAQAASGTGGSPASLDGCTLVTAAELSHAVGVHYTAIQASVGSLCNVTGTQPTSSFTFSINKAAGPLNSWTSQVATIKKDDGSVKNVSGIGDRAVQGAIKEFAAEAKGYIVVVINADVNNPPTASSFTRTKAIERLLISKL